MCRLLQTVLWASAALAVFLAFVWPLLLGTDPADRTFEFLAKSAFATFMAALAALLVLRLRR